jgi:hypothetical protein
MTMVTMPRDIDGDFGVDLYDTVKFLVVYEARKGQPDCDSNLDIDDNR